MYRPQDRIHTTGHDRAEIDHCYAVVNDTIDDILLEGVAGFQLKGIFFVEGAAIRRGLRGIVEDKSCARGDD